MKMYRVLRYPKFTLKKKLKQKLDLHYKKLIYKACFPDDSVLGN